MEISRPLLWLLAAAAASSGAADNAGDIMARVAANQERSVAQRSRWTHHQEIFGRVTKSGHQVVREEQREYVVLPGPDGMKKELLKSTRKPEGDEGMDAELLDDVIDDLMDDNSSRDGIRANFFPFTRVEQQKYTFHLAGREKFRDRDVWKIEFRPANREASIWSGEALIDVAESQPVLVTTHMSRKVPLAVRTLLGTNIGHLGFKVSYRKLEDGVWIPETYGGEFSIRALFFYNRKIGLRLKNSDFRAADVNSTIEYSVPPMLTGQRAHQR